MAVAVLIALLVLICSMFYSYIDATALPGEMFEDITAKSLRYGYTATLHKVTTSDGYELSLYRLSSPFHPSPSPPVLFLHGIGVNGDQFTVNLHTKPVAYRLVEEGFDVWVSNMRGTPYSEGHKLGLTVDMPEYWEWSAEELVQRDMKAILGEVEAVTGKQVVVIGHSQGAMVGMAYLAMFPDDNDKVSLLITIACPGAKNSNETWLFKLFLHPLTHSFFSFIGKFHFFRPSQSLFYPKILTRFPSIGYYYVRSRYNPRLNGDIEDKAGLYAYKLAGGTSLKNLRYLGQHVGAEDPRPRRYDYGEEENLLRYGSPIPPFYNYTQITTPIAFLGGKHDQLVKPSDIEALISIFPAEKVVFTKLDYNHDHGSFALSRNQEHVEDIVRLIRKYGH